MLLAFYGFVNIPILEVNFWIIKCEGNSINNQNKINFKILVFTILCDMPSLYHSSCYKLCIRCEQFIKVIPLKGYTKD